MSCWVTQDAEACFLLICSTQCRSDCSLWTWMSWSPELALQLVLTAYHTCELRLTHYDQVTYIAREGSGILFRSILSFGPSKGSARMLLKISFHFLLLWMRCFLCDAIDQPLKLTAASRLGSSTDHSATPSYTLKTLYKVRNAIQLMYRTIINRFRKMSPGRRSASSEASVPSEGHDPLAEILHRATARTRTPDNKAGGTCGEDRILALPGRFV